MTNTVGDPEDVTDGATAHQLCWDFGPGELPPLTAIRQQLATWLTGIAQAVVADLQLVATELVSNAYEHGWLPGQVRVSRPDPRLIRIEVDDRSPTLPQLGQPTIAETRGRGLGLVDRLAKRWGVISTSWGKTVWAEIAVPS
ncbi:ATP-binding protein [Actinophytocola sp.]|uniref:ATP-binding protein n=1 Tax=Actinophytocola sp. TaxID=1872138 RepID=UPI00389A37C7